MRKFLAGVVSALAICCVVMAFVHMGHMHPAQPAEFNVATYNIRQGNHGDSIKGNGWGQRLPWITSLIRFHEFDIFGTQEAFRYQLNDMLAELPGYAFIGVAREDGKEEGEHFSYLPNGKFNSYMSDGFSESRIDHIFLTQQFHVTRYGVLTDSYRRKESGVIVDAESAPSEISIEQYSARNPSDHFPVEISVILQ